MKIGMEARWITFEKTGFGNYALNLLRELSKIDNKNEYLVYLNKDYVNNNIFSNPNFEKKIISKRPEIYKHLSIPIDIITKKRKFDFFHFLYNAPSLIVPCPFVLTIHDVSYKYIPNMISKRNLMSITLQLTLNARKAVKIITVSENSKKDIVNFFHIPEEKIEVIYEGVDNSFRPVRDEQKKKEIGEKYGLPDKFILYVGTYLPHKNLETLLYAYRDVKKQLKIPHSLVLAGNKGRNYEEISRLISKLDLGKDVKTIGFVPDEDLPSVYSLSDLFVFPSHYEGFGLPLLEAMACGVPVISSDASCLPEIGGDAVIYFSAEDVEGLTKKMIKVISNKNLRDDLIERGIHRAKLFSWRKMAEATLKVYEDVYQELHIKGSVHKHRPAEYDG
jgi:glycosyltransferase involved in cell wall biosynthesis